MKNLLTIIIILTLSACSMFKEKGIDVHIKNESGDPITNVEITTTEELEVIKIERIQPNKAASDFLSMRENKLDGSYVLSFNRASGKRDTIVHGYYTNGAPINNWVEFIVKNDTTLVNYNAPIK